jgi:hypothetical protein
MPRIRSVKPEFFTSPGTAAVDFPVRLFYQALWCAADDFGIGETNFNALLGLAFPDSDGFSAQDVRRFCADCAQHFGTVFYSVRGRHFYAIPTWDKHQKTERREARRKNPFVDDPDAVPDQRIYDCADFAPDMPRKTCAESRETGAGTGEQGNRGTGEQGNSVEPRKRGTRLDPDWRPTQSTVDTIKAECPGVDLGAEHRKFVDYWIAKAGSSGSKLDWDATWRNWMRNARPTLGATVGHSAVDSKVNGWLELAQAGNMGEVGA